MTEAWRYLRSDPSCVEPPGMQVAGESWADGPDVGSLPGLQPSNLHSVQQDPPQILPIAHLFVQNLDE